MASSPPGAPSLAHPLLRSRRTWLVCESGHEGWGDLDTDGGTLAEASVRVTSEAIVGPLSIAAAVITHLSHAPLAPEGGVIELSDAAGLDDAVDRRLSHATLERSPDAALARPPGYCGGYRNGAQPLPWTGCGV